MAFRLLRYMVRIWDDYLGNTSTAVKLPVILPLVLHHSWRYLVTASNPADPRELIKQLLAVVGKEEEREIMTIADWYEDRGRQAGLRTGRDEGLRAGARNVLLKQLRMRFGALTDTAEARIQAADTAQLDVWTDRVLTAATLDEVLGAG